MTEHDKDYYSARIANMSAWATMREFINHANAIAAVAGISNVDVYEAVASAVRTHDALEKYRLNGGDIIGQEACKTDPEDC